MKFWVALHKIPQLGTVRFRRLEAYFGELANSWTATPGQLRDAGLESRVANEIVSARARISPDEEKSKLRQYGVAVVNWHDPVYPARLKEISDPPPVLYYQGELLPSDERAVAVVGTRSPTTYGREVAANLSAELARVGINIVSGLALGIDTVAHRAALENGGRTIAVVANGLDMVYPKRVCEKSF